MKKLVTLFIFLFPASIIYAQLPPPPAESASSQSSVNWEVSVGYAKAFIENKSQFDGRNELPGSQILFGIDWGATQIYFTKNGLTYHLAQKKFDEEEERERELRKFKGIYTAKDEEEKDEDFEIITDVVHVQWVNANPDAKVIAYEPAEDYFSYSIKDGDLLKNTNHIKGFGKLLYQNLYSNIDVEYTFHPDGGIKYKIILHPGADVSEVKMEYSNVEGVNFDENGNIHLPTLFGDIIDHAPVTFYADGKMKAIPSRFVLEDKTVSFKLKKYDKRATVIIDPWTVTPAMPSVNKVYYIKTDKAGNAYIYGGDSPYRLQKYNSSGALIWSYNTPWSVGGSNWFGALEVDAVGNSYITSGSSAEISKIDSTGEVSWHAAGGFSDEYWDMDFNCDYTQLVVGGTRIVNPLAFQFSGMLFNINLNNGSVINTVAVANTVAGVLPNPPFIGNEVRSLCASPNGNYYFLTIDTIGSVTPSFGFNFRKLSSYILSYYLPYGQGGTGQGINGIQATGNLFYTTDGQVLHKRDINNGNILTTVTIPNGSKEVNSGIAIDSCGNVYVGSVARIHQYDQNLNLLSTANAPAQVFDVSVTKNGEVLACGIGFAMSVNMGACTPIPRVCVVPFTVSMSQTNTLCNGQCTGTATATPINGNAPYTYLWSNGQTSQTVTALCAGPHVVTVTDVTSRTSIASVIITQPPPFTVDVSSSLTGCSAIAFATPSGSAGPFVYSWSNGASTAINSNLASGTYSVTAYNSNNCSASDSVTITQTVGFVISDSRTNSICGGCTGTASATPSSGNPPFTYLWSNSDTTQTITGLCPGAYTVTVTETGGGGGNPLFWSEDFTNSGAGWTLNIAGPGTNAANANEWVVNNNVSACSQCPAAGSGGNYLHVTCFTFPTCFGDAGSCIYDVGAPFLFNATTDKFVSSPNISTIGRTAITLSFWYMSDGEPGIDYGLVRLSKDGGINWTDLLTEYSGTSTCTQTAISIPPAYEGISNFRIGFRWVNDNNTDGSDPPFMIDDIQLTGTGVSTACSATGLININSINGPEVTLVSKTDVGCFGAGDGAIDINVSSGTPSYTYSWTGGATTQDISGLSGGIYTVSVTDSGNCISTLSVNINEPSSELLISGTVTNSGCSPTGAVDLTVIGGSFPYGYLWINGAITQDVTNIPAGTYTVTITDNNSCSRLDTFIVGGPPTVSISLTPTNTSCRGVADGGITSSVTGGVSPFQYLWNNGATTPGITNVQGGIYTLTVTDINGCAISNSATVSEPSSISMSISITRVICESGTNGGIKLIPVGGTPPYTAVWSNGDTTLSIDDLEPDIYSVTVTDANGCVEDTSIALNAFSSYEVDAVGFDATCEGATNGSAIANIISGNAPPYRYTWSTGSTVDSISDLPPGIYTVTVIDSLNCPESDTVVIGTEGGLIIDEIIDNATCPFRPDGSITVTASGGTAPYYYLWNTGDSTSALLNITSGNYSLIVTDFNDCAGVDTIFVPFDSTTADCDTVIIYDVFSPNGDASNDLWIIDGLVNYPDNEIQIFNRWGNLVFEAKPYNNDWDGHSKKDEPLPTATYYYILKLNDPDKTVYSGDITLIR